ncbi:MAG: hypothetical protein A2887_03860 [Alphaproteobacteria bacterium RIFCSPLOWO2_01_FULL_40_26]|nr:MAG: hypothetical protein A3D15_05015 [Alphaproteobacteria bacterium RIFCSPHIGHO2_02_FULL_40_34]OFW87982.1 MAG: hypothetical protein A2794_00760 [Alphaproteobacteria bacterium RIFCSPHIGHO2_01_FULL_40_8]OFW95333.1 MAG: hypothetical protein A2887_03860 [Alphaproteobacteria bacterium RIFCSPLOWO2_01_FULL_40_26]OFX09236.1 MAG: hypothetical protein A3H30_06565 [Alphaproteobacteria bacterium RIFCSPLOWO2_02_FULL_40_19]OFX11591.1 MAG: hypothetical protein A3G22_05170 [Alphaproteobacteria bacterium RI
MVEKNTHSILETIKKKLHKFDQKQEKNAVMTGISDEFEYVTPTKKEEVKSETTDQKTAEQNTKQVSEAENKNLEDAIDLTPDLATIQLDKASKQENKLDDFNLDDLDLDNEGQAEQQSQVQQANSTTAENPIYDEFAESDIEDYEDEVDFAEEDSVVEKSTAADSTEDQQTDEDLIFAKDDELNLEEETDKQPEEEQADDDLNLDDLEIEETEEEIQEQLTASDDDLDLSNFEEELQEEQKTDQQTTSPQQENLKQENHPDDLELEDLEKELEEQQKKQEEAERPKAEEVLNPVAKDEIDLEFEKELMGFKPEETVNEITKPAIPTPQTNQTIQPMSEPVKTISAEHHMISEETAIKTTESIKKLIDAKNVVSGITSFSQSPMLQELAVQLLEPKLERWLNENLTQLVEKIVREEIKKIIPKE